MNKRDIEDAVRQILDKKESPLASALKAEIASYEHSALELKVLHRNNLRQLLYAFEKRGITDNQTAKDIEKRLESL